MSSSGSYYYPSINSYKSNVLVNNTEHSAVPMAFTNGSPYHDSFGRLRTSTPFIIFDSRLIHGQLRSLFWTPKIVQSGTYIQLTASATDTIKISGTRGDGVIVQTNQYMHYVPGISFRAFMTFNFSGSQQGVVKGVGYLDDLDGYYLELSGNNLNIVERSSVSNRGRLSHRD